MSLDHHLEVFVAAIVAGKSKAAAFRAAYADRHARNPTQNADRILARRSVRARLAALGVGDAPGDHAYVQCPCAPHNAPGVETFARLLVDGVTHVAAYRMAFPERAGGRNPHERARRLLRRQGVAARVAGLRALADAEARAALAELASDLGMGIALGAAAAALSETRVTVAQASADSGRDLRLREFMCFASARAPQAPQDQQ